MINYSKIIKHHVGNYLTHKQPLIIENIYNSKMHIDYIKKDTTHELAASDNATSWKFSPVLTEG